MVPGDLAELRQALERQLSWLTPLARLAAAEAQRPPRVHPDDWRGPAARACEALEQQLAHELRTVDSALRSACRELRAALVEVGG